MPQEVSSPNPPPRPRPRFSFASTAAFASRSRTTTESWPLRAAQCSGVMPRKPRPKAKPRAEPNGTKRRKTLRKFWAPQKSKFWKFVAAHSKILPGLNEQCGFEDVLMTSSWLKRPCEPDWQSKCFAETLKNVLSLRKQIWRMPAIGTQQNLKSVPCSRYFL